jgi:hypothetical protein
MTYSACVSPVVYPRDIIGGTSVSDEWQIEIVGEEEDNGSQPQEDKLSA